MRHYFILNSHKVFLCILAIRLEGLDRPHAGRIEVLHKGIWGSVNDFLSWTINNNFSLSEAKVACQQLGYRDALRPLNIQEVPNARKGTIWTKTIGCDGTERQLQDCKWNTDNSRGLQHSYDAGVICKISKLSLTCKPVSTRGPYPATMHVVNVISLYHLVK